MSNPIFSARFTLYTATLVSPFTDRWQCTGKIEDGEGTYSASNVAVNNAVFLDTQGDVPVGGSVSRYRVISINSADTPNFGDIDFVLEYDDTGTPVDPIIAGFQYSFVCSQSENQSLAWIAANDVQGLAQRVVTLARNTDIYNKLDAFLKKLVKNQTGITIPQYKLVAWEDDGSVALATASVHSLSDIAGVTTKAINDGEWGWIVKTGYIPGALSGLNAVPGDTIYLSETPGEMTRICPTAYTDTIIKIGRAEPPSGVLSSIANDLHMEIEVMAEP